MFYNTTATKKVAKLSKKIRVVQGGTSASKTISILIYFISMAQSDKTPTLSSIVSESIPHLKKGALRDFKNIMKAHNYWVDSRWGETDKIYTFETGSQIEFFGADQSEKLRGGRRDRGFMNECNNLSLESFDEFEVRTKEFVFLDFNPTREFWLFTDVLNTRTDIEHIILTYKDNEACPPEIVSSIESRKNRKGWWRVYGEGLLGEVEGKIYKDWQILDDIPHEARYVRTGMDFGYTNDPTAIVDVYYYNGGYILDEVVCQKGLLNKQIADILLMSENFKRVVVADAAEPKSIDEIKLHGVNIFGSNKGQGAVCHRISVVQGLRVSVTKRSVNVIKAYRNYLWATDRDGKILNEPEHEFSDPMDAAGYGLESVSKTEKDAFTDTRLKEQFRRNENRSHLNSSR